MQISQLGSDCPGVWRGLRLLGVTLVEGVQTTAPREASLGNDAECRGPPGQSDPALGDEGDRDEMRNEREKQ